MDLTEAAKKAEPHRRRDFWAGFGCTTLVIILFVAMTIPGWRLNTGLGVMLTIFALGLAIGAVFWAFAAKRRRVAYGILTALGVALAIPLLLMGACFIAFSSGLH